MPPETRRARESVAFSAAFELRDVSKLFGELVAQGACLEGMVLKPNMVVPGNEAPQQATVETVAAATIGLLRRTVPAAVPGIAFLSGGQGPELATAHLAAMVALGPHPWEVTFSFGRALVGPALEAWHGDPGRVSAGHEALAARSRANSEARRSPLRLLRLEIGSTPSPATF